MTGWMIDYSYKDFGELYKDRLLTNFNQEERYIYEKAIKMYKHKHYESDLYIQDDAYDVYNRLIKRDNSLRRSGTDNKLDLGEFWSIFDFLKYEYFS